MGLLGTAVLGHSSAGSEAPMRVAFYYGYPSLVNGSAGDVQRAAQHFAQYGLVVLGDGVEFSSVVKRRQPSGVGLIEYQRTKEIMRAVHQRNAHTSFLGYVCIGDSQALKGTEIERRIRLWKTMGVSGVFLDEAGYDWEIVTRARQNAAIRYAHSLGLTAFVNAYYPKDLFLDSVGSAKNANSEKTALQANDAVLLESFPIKNGSYVPVEEWRDRLDQALQLRDHIGVKVVTLATSHPERPLEQQPVEYSCWNAWMFDLDGVALGSPNLSSDNNLFTLSCPVLERLPAKGHAQAGKLHPGHIFERQTGDGVVVLDVQRNTVHLKKNSADNDHRAPFQEAVRQRDAISR